MSAHISAAQRARCLAELHARRAAGETFAAICATPGWPSRPTLRRWLRETPGAENLPRLRRPSVRYSPALAAEICDRFEVQSLREICAMPGMPDRKTLNAWRRRRPAFAAVLDIARREARQPPTGRSTYCALVAKDVCEAVLHAGSIGAACRGPDFPPARTVRDWARAHPDFLRQLQIAYDMAAESRIAPARDALQTWLRTRGGEEG